MKTLLQLQLFHELTEQMSFLPSFLPSVFRCSWMSADTCKAVEDRLRSSGWGAGGTGTTLAAYHATTSGQYDWARWTRATGHVCESDVKRYGGALVGPSTTVKTTAAKTQASFFPKPTCPDEAKSISECETWNWPDSENLGPVTTVALECVWDAKQKCTCNYSPPFCKQGFAPGHTTTYTTTKVQVPVIYTTSSSSTLSTDTSIVGGVDTSTTATTQTMSLAPFTSMTTLPSVTTSAPPKVDHRTVAIIKTLVVGLLIGMLIGMLINVWLKTQTCACCALRGCCAGATGGAARVGHARRRIMQCPGLTYEALPLNDANDSASGVGGSWGGTGDDELLEHRA